MASNNTGNNNTAVGAFALRLNTSGNFNVALGQSLSNNIAGNENTGVGWWALNANGGGSGNTAVGRLAMGANTTGGQNVAVGREALNTNTVGNNNTAVGNGALWFNQNGNNNTAIGNFATTNPGFNFTNATALGNGAVALSGNRVRVGNTTVQTIEGQVDWSFPSDGRFKNNVVEEDIKGLSFIKKLRPVAYNFDTRKFQEFVTQNMPDSIRNIYMKQDFGPSMEVRHSGFIAQEVEKAAKEAGYHFSAVHKPENEHDNYSIAYSQFVVPLVKAVQEQQQMIEELQREIKMLKGEYTTHTIPVQNVELQNTVVLEQNVPNPFAQQTRIDYEIPISAKTAQMVFYSIDGTAIKTVTLNNKGKAQLQVFAGDLHNGSYTYTLVIDGRAAATRKLVKQ